MIIELAPGRLDEVRELRATLHAHHAALPTPPGWALRDADEAWSAWHKAAKLAVTFRDQAVFVAGEDEFGPWDGMAHVALLPEHARPILQPTGRHGELEVLIVADSARGQGVGTALTDAAADWLRAREAVAMEIAVRATNESALRFYRERGGVDTFVTLFEDLRR